MAKPNCSVEGCENIAATRGWCPTHYGRWQRHGDTAAKQIRHSGSPEQRFWAKTDKTQGCWNWKAATGSHGYGVIGIGEPGLREPPPSPDRD